jgi:predicted dehydrogenase
MNLAIVGCGNIAGPYSKDIVARSALNLKTPLHIVGFYDLDITRAHALANQYGGRVYVSLEDVLNDEQVDIVVNLTIFEAHYSITKQGLLAGKHVYSEKPLALTNDQAQELVELAEKMGKSLACAPITFLGEAQQTAIQHLRAGLIGELRLVYAEVNHGRIESWHPNPAPFYAVGPLLDVGVYPLTLATALLGPASQLSAFATTLQPNRRTKDGEEFTVAAPDFYVVLLEWPSGVVLRLTCNFYVPSTNKQGSSIEFHGDGGSLALGSWFYADTSLEHAEYGKKYSPVPLSRPARQSIDWSVGVYDFAHAIATGQPARVTGAQAAHIVEILSAATTSVREARFVQLTTRFVLPDLVTE